MAIDTNLNQDPYFDDYSVNKDFHRVLFKPAVAVQAREMNQLQAILQNQIEQFGDNILQNGTIVKGCNFTYLNRLPFVKILDLDTSSQNVTMSNYVGLRAVGLSTGVEAYVVAVKTGLQSQTPNLNTLYIRYVTSSGANKTFSSTENIRLENFTTAAVVTTVTAAGTIGTSIGNGVGLTVGDGFIYQKGNFIRVDQQTTIIERYSTTPDGVAVGFNTSEEIINSNVDTTLLDNAEGFNNENAPGADRLKLTPTLTVKTVAAANADENFFTLIEYQNGNAVRRKEKTQYSVIGEEFARRTSEESGDYVVEKFPLNIEATDNANTLNVRIGSGLAYVDGYRVKTHSSIDTEIDVSGNYVSVTQQNVTTNLGHYIIVDEFYGDMKFDQLQSVNLHDGTQSAATAATVVVPASANGSVIGTAKIRGVEYHSGTVGAADCQYRLYLFDIRMANNSVTFDSTKSIVYDGTRDGSGDIVLEGGKAKIKDFSFKKNFWPIGKNAIKTVLGGPSSDYVYRTYTTMNVTAGVPGEGSITAPTDSVFPYSDGTLSLTQKRDDLVVVDVNGLPVNLDSVIVTIAASGTTMNFSGFSGIATDGLAAVSYKVKRNANLIKTKDSKTVYVKVWVDVTPGGTTGTWSLGLPDCYELVGVWQGTDITVSELDTDVTSNFRLYPNQRDAYYDLSFVKKARAFTISSGQWYLLKVKVFEESGSGLCMATVDSYVSLPSAPIDIQDIPTYTSESGVRYDLRDVLDFRPHCSNTVSYTSDDVAASVVTSTVGDTPTFPASDAFTPAPNENAEIDYDYYLGRIDKLIVDNVGQFKLITGEPSENPTPPSDPSKGLVLAKVNIPPYPALTPLVAARANKDSYGTKIIPNTNNKGYTMREIGSLDRRITNLEYYASLNALETSAKDKAIVDANGLDRFKNGIFVDNFLDFYSADVKNSEFGASINPSFEEAQPKFRQFDVDLKVSTTSGVTNFGKLATLNKTDVTFITQPYATKTRNAVQDFYQYNGNMFIFPDYDSGYDVTRAPDFNIDIDITQPFVDFAEAINEFVPLQQVRRRVARTGRQTDPNTFTTTTTTTTTTTELNINTEETQRDVGEFVTDVRFNPFMRSQEIKILVHGLRPNTTFYFYFDGQSITNDVARAVSIDDNTDDVVNFRRSSEYGATITSDSNGTLRAIFKIPSGTFFVGERKLEIMDVSSYSDKVTAISRAQKNYNAFNYSVEKTNVGVNVRQPSINVTRSTSVSRSVDTRIIEAFDNESSTNGDGSDGIDPIAQTFYIKSSMCSGDNVLYATKIDLYFKEKSDTAGFTFEIREVESGFITNKILPFSTVHVLSSSVNANNTAAAATTVTFDGPIALEAEREYAFVIKPDGNNPDYLIWVAKTGETDVLNNIAITQDSNDGTLFTSTNARTWTPYQDENIKYTLYRANFSTSSGTVTFTNKDSEYLTINSISGSFKSGEYVFLDAANNSGTVSIVAGNSEINGDASCTFTSDYTVGDFIVVRATNSIYDVLEIKSVANDNFMEVYDPPKYSNNASAHFQSIVGKVSLFESRLPSRLYLEESSAASGAGNYFEANTQVIGAESNATCTIESVDDKNVSFVAPNIYKTNTTQTKTTLKLGVPGSLTTSSFDNYNYLNTTDTVIKSRSNEIVDDAGAKSFSWEVTLENTSGTTPRYSSPVIDVDVASCKMFEYVVNNTNTDEDTTDGAAESKYISKIITLSDGLDAEDLRVYLTAYRPPATTIEVYAKFLASSDSEEFALKPWTKMDGSASNPVSQNSNRYDFREHQFNLPTTAPVSGAAYLNSSDVIEYTNTNGIFNNYKYFALKIVFLASAHNVVPRLKDIRAIALSA